MKFLMLFIALLTLGCKSQEKSVVNSQEINTEPVELKLVLSDNYGGTAIEEFRVIRKAADLKKFMAEINRTRKPRLPMPEIDFEKEVGILYCSGGTSTTVIPRLYKVGESDERLTLDIIDKGKTPEGGQTASLMPFGLYTMPLTDKAIVLSRSK